VLAGAEVMMWAGGADVCAGWWCYADVLVVLRC
jgi:hypothetical protein